MVCSCGCAEDETSGIYSDGGETRQIKKNEPNIKRIVLEFVFTIPLVLSSFSSASPPILVVPFRWKIYVIWTMSNIKEKQRTEKKVWAETKSSLISLCDANICFRWRSFRFFFCVFPTRTGAPNCAARSASIFHSAFVTWMHSVSETRSVWLGWIGCMTVTTE